MNRQENIVVYDVSLIQFKNDKTGEVREMTKIFYLKEKSDHTGYRPLSCFIQGDKVNIVTKFMIKATTKAVLSEKDTEQGVKFTIAKIENETL